MSLERVAKLEEHIAKIREQLKESEAAERKLVQAIRLCQDNLVMFNSKRKSQLQIIAMPSLRSAIKAAQETLVETARIREAEDKLNDAENA